MLAITRYSIEEYYDGTLVPVCFSQVDTVLPALFFVLSITLFFFLPLAILIILYALIAKALMEHPPAHMVAPYKCDQQGNTALPHSVIKYRKQVVLMLGTVVLAFFICLLPFRALVLWIIVVPADSILKYGLEGYWNILYFCRIMFHINSAINPILYNIMSSKFRGGFLRLCGVHRRRRRLKVAQDGSVINRKNTFNTTSSTATTTTRESSNNESSSSSFWRRYSYGSGRREARRQRSGSSTNNASGANIQAGVATVKDDVTRKLSGSNGISRTESRETKTTSKQQNNNVLKANADNRLAKIASDIIAGGGTIGVGGNLRECYVRIPLRPDQQQQGLKSAKILISGESYV